MSRYLRGQYFDALCGLRSANAAATDEDRLSVISVEDMMIYAGAVMTALAAEDTTPAPEAVAVEESSAPSDPRD